MWFAWKTLFLNIVDKHAPIEGFHGGQCQHEKDNLQKTEIKSNDPSEWANFKKIRNQVNNEINNAKDYKNDFHDCKGNSRTTWVLIQRYF